MSSGIWTAREASGENSSERRNLLKFGREVQILPSSDIDKQRIWNLAYADDIVLLAKNREALHDMVVLEVLEDF